MTLVLSYVKWISLLSETSVGHAKPGQFSIPHSLTLASDFGQLCAADRENGRIQCFKPETGKFVREIRHPSFGREVFAVAYAPGKYKKVLHWSSLLLVSVTL